MSLRVNGNSENKDSIKLNKVMTNPFINTVFDGKLISAGKNGKVSLKEQLYMNTANLPDGLREKFLEYLENRTVKREFIDLLNVTKKNRLNLRLPGQNIKPLKTILNFLRKYTILLKINMLIQIAILN